MVQERNYLIHPSYIILTLVLAGVTVLFLGFSASYLYNRIQSGLTPIHLPWLFYVNSLLLMGSGYSLIQAKQSYINDNTERYRIMLVITMVLTLVFLLAQTVAWYQLFNENISLQSGNMAAYMYLISGLHFAHVIAGIPFLGYFIYISLIRR